MSSKSSSTARAPGSAVAKLLGQQHGDRRVSLRSGRVHNDALLLGLVSSQCQLDTAAYGHSPRAEKN
ncbi:MAG: hypothetical protein ACI9DC_004836 [Gammaproteobacteria bacterium]|jgi:hypothetical protein